MEHVVSPNHTPGNVAVADVAAASVGASGDGAPADGERPLPPSYYRLLDEAPGDLRGGDLMRWFVERLQRLPQKDRDEVLTLYESFARGMIILDASDLDLGGPAANGYAWYRVDGDKKPFPELGEMTVQETDLMILTQLSPSQQKKIIEQLSADFSYSIVDGGKERRYRATSYWDNQHLAICMRLLAGEPRPLRSLGFHPAIEKGFLFSQVRDGLTLFTGVTGSGKSTTLDAIIDANNQDTAGHILLVAQPIEYVHTSKKCIIRHREVGSDVTSFADGMIQGLRQDPDIVVVGEMRDRETISAAMETADTGHKVFSTLHTASAVESVDRIVAEYPSEEQDRVRYRLGDILRCVVSQKLLPAIGGGRVLAKEVLWCTSSVKAAIKNGNTHEIYQMLWQGSKQGMTTLEQDLARLVRSGEVTPESAVNYANNKRRLIALLR